MIKYISTKGGGEPVDFEEAVVEGFAPDGGLFVPDKIPRVTEEQLEAWRNLTYPELAFEILSLYIDPSIIPREDLKELLRKSFEPFETPEVIPVVPFEDKNTYIMELFRGPTLAFKDVAMGVLVNMLDYFLVKRNRHMSIIMATTGDTGPAAAWASAGKDSIDCWSLYPDGMISPEQELQMTSIQDQNVHPIAVQNCPDGGDDLDRVILSMMSNPELKKRLNLCTVNSINLCRVVAQSVHYFYGYYQVTEKPGDKVVFSVPSGAFGNLYAGTLARSMGLPVERFICANNSNQTLHTTFARGLFQKKDLVETYSCAMDIVYPYNFFRFLYFSSGADPKKINQWQKTYDATGRAELDPETWREIQKGMESISIPDELIAKTISGVFKGPTGYLLDPHTTVAVAAARELKDKLPEEAKILCLATAHPAKFPATMKKILEIEYELPEQALHHSIEDSRNAKENKTLCDLSVLEYTLVNGISDSLEISLDKV